MNGEKNITVCNDNNDYNPFEHRKVEKPNS